MKIAYTSNLKQGKFKAVSVQGTPLGTLEEVCVCVDLNFQKCCIGTSVPHSLSLGHKFHGYTLHSVVKA